MPPAPASMLRTNRSWPGTSTNAILTSPTVACAKPEIDRDAARLFFLQAIRIGAGQRFDERALAVIDVPGGADDDASAPNALGAGARCRRGPPGTAAPAAIAIRRGFALLRARLFRRGARRPSATGAFGRRSRMSADPEVHLTALEIDPDHLHVARDRPAGRRGRSSRRAGCALAPRTGSSRPPSSRRAPCLRRSAPRARCRGQTR